MTRGIAAAIGALIATSVAQAQQAAPSTDHDAIFALPRLSGPITVDGRSDDPAWQAVAPLPLTVYLPTHAAAATERTVARVAYDDDALYVVVDAWEAHPGGVRASTMMRDDDAPGDYINLALDTFGDRQNAVGFGTTPGGQRNDVSISGDAGSGASISSAWNGVWQVSTRRGSDGWHAEFRIPFSTLRFSSHGDRVVFGFSLNRLTAHSNERVTFPAIQPNAPLALWKPSRWQRVSVAGIQSGRALRVTPYIAASLEGARTPDPALSPWEEKERLEIGGDLKMAVTSSTTLDLTVNTDFAEAEVDDQGVNLTRFPLFLPERRAFFVERAGTFEVKTGETDLLFTTRRVGLTAAGESVRLLGGARLVGQVGGWDIGLFDAQTGRTPAGTRENAGVLRLRRRVLNPHSWAGVMVASRATPDSTQVALGADGDLGLGGDHYLSFALATLAGIAGAGPDAGVLPRGALRVVAERRRNRGAWYRVAVATTGARYAPALGYVQHADAIQPSLELGYGRVISAAGSQLRLSTSTALAYRNAEGTFEGSATAVHVAYEKAGGTLWDLTLTRQQDDLVSGFTPASGTSVGPGRYRADYLKLALTASAGPRVALGGALRAGGYYDGTLYSLALSPEWRASVHLRLSADLELDRIEFATRDQREWSRLVRLRAIASATPRLSLSAVIQASNVSELATANLRLRYNLGEGHDLWVVYNYHLNLDRDRMAPSAPETARAGLLIKYSKSFGT